MPRPHLAGRVGDLAWLYTFADGEPACTISHIGHMGTYSIRKDSDARTHDIDCPNC